MWCFQRKGQGEAGRLQPLEGGLFLKIGARLIVTTDTNMVGEQIMKQMQRCSNSKLFPTRISIAVYHPIFSAWVLCSTGRNRVVLYLYQHLKFALLTKTNNILKNRTFWTTIAIFPDTHPTRLHACRSHFCITVNVLAASSAQMRKFRQSAKIPDVLL